MAQTDSQAPTRPPTPEESSGPRVRAVHERVLEGKAKLPETFSECRWGVVDNVVVAILSKVTDARYLIDRQTGTFWRTLSPDTPAKIMSCNPKQVVDEDREWLFPMFKSIPGGDEVLRRYSQNPGAAPAAPPSPLPDPSRALEGGPLASLGLRALRPESSEKRTVLIERTKRLPVAGYQVTGLLRLAGVDLPETAKLEAVDERGYLVLSWTESEAREEEGS